MPARLTRAAATALVQAQLGDRAVCTLAIDCDVVRGSVKRARLLAYVNHVDHPTEPSLFLYLQRPTGPPQVLVVSRLLKETTLTIVDPDEAKDLYDDNIYSDGNEVPLLCFALEDDEELIALPTNVSDIAAVEAEHAARQSTAISLPPTADDASDAAAAAQATAVSTTPTAYEWALPFRDQAAASPSAELNRMETVDNTTLDVAAAEMNANAAANPFVNMEVFQNSVVAPKTFRDLKDAWIRKQVTAREKEYTEYKKLTMFVGTWNVNGRMAAESLAPWLSFDAADADIYVMGFQELDLSASAFLLDNSAREEDWTRLIDQGIRNRKNYRKLVSKQLVGMLLIVYVKMDHMSHIKDVSTGSIGTGIMGMMGNKGGVGIRFRIYDSYMVFVNSHLASGTKEVERRNLDFREISQKLLFPNSAGTLDDPNKVPTIYDSDYLIWLGDLNYRIPQPAEPVKAKVAKKLFKSLLRSDQLNVERKAQRAFNGFEEMAIPFAPSYKYDPGTDQFDTRRAMHSEKQRAPAWCDRILYRSGDAIRQTGYRVHMDLRTSDHKPVSAWFEATKVKVYHKDQQAEVQMAIVRDLDKFENECMPDAELSTNLVEFGKVKYLVPTIATVTLVNVGQVLLQYKFIPKPNETKFAKPWMSISPEMGLLVPGEKKDISLRALVNNESVGLFTGNNLSMDDIIVLHLENGKDFFISVTGEFLPTCFGLSLDTLTTLAHPVRGERPADAVAAEAPKGQFSIPKELFRMAEFIYSRGLKEEQLFMAQGDDAECEHIRDALDTGHEFSLEGSSTAVHSMVSTLLAFLEALPEPVIPFAFYQRCLDANQTAVLAKQVANQLPVVHKHVFMYLTGLGLDILQQRRQSGVAGISKQDLASVLSRVMVRPMKQVAAKYQKLVDTRRTQFIAHFLTGAGEQPTA